MQRQLNIRSNRASELARKLSSHLGVSTARVVESALEELARKQNMQDLTELRSTRVTREQADRFRTELQDLIEAANKGGQPDLDDKRLYDENGLLK